MLANKIGTSLPIVNEETMCSDTYEFVQRERLVDWKWWLLGEQYIEDRRLFYALLLILHNFLLLYTSHIFRFNSPEYLSKTYLSIRIMKHYAKCERLNDFN